MRISEMPNNEAQPSSGHMTFFDIEATLYRRHVPTGHYADRKHICNLEQHQLGQQGFDQVQP